jgi:hypothetical protein
MNNTYYAVNFSGGQWSNDSGESAYYCGVYSSLKLAKQFLQKEMIRELMDSDGQFNDEGEEIDLSKLSFKKLKEHYDDIMEASYEIKAHKIPECNDAVYALDYRPTGNLLGLFLSPEEASKVSVKFIKPSFHKLMDDVFITKFKLNAPFFHLDWDNDCKLTCPNEAHESYSLIDATDSTLRTL